MAAENTGRDTLLAAPEGAWFWRQIRQARNDFEALPSWMKTPEAKEAMMDTDRDPHVLEAVVYEPLRPARVTLVMTQEEAQAVYAKLHVYDESDGFLERGNVARRLLYSGAVGTVPGDGSGDE